MPDIEQEFLSVFLEEAEDILQRLESELVELDKNKTDNDVINKVFRSFHTIKGSGGMVGLSELAAYTHTLESILDRARSREVEINEETVSLFLKGLDKIKTYIGFIKKDEIPDNFFEIDESGTQSISDNTQTINANQEERIEIEIKEEEFKDKRLEKNYFQINLAFKEDILKIGTNPLLLLKELSENAELDAVFPNDSKIPDFQTADFSLFYLKWKIYCQSSLSKNEIEEIFIFVKDDNPIEIYQLDKNKYEDLILHEKNFDDDKIGTILLNDGILSEKDLEETLKTQKELGVILAETGYIDSSMIKESQKHKIEKEQSFIRVNTEKLDRLLNFVSELIISHSRVYSLINQLSKYAVDSMELTNIISGLENLTREIQEQVMSIRMIPLGPTFIQFNRLVRELAKKQNKKIELEIIGAETELDKNMIELISDPLKHMVRNSIDHGLETPEERKASGKKETGTLILEAYYKEGNVIIEVRDDGKGLDKTRILAKALEKELIHSDQNLSENEIFNLIFQPGFSTAEQVTDLSGRGVGMDVVKQNIEKLRGRIEIESEDGKGARFKIILPLTMAIIDGMLVKTNNTYYVIPLLSIVESFKPEKDIVSSVEGNVEVIEYRNEYIPLVRLNEILYSVKESKNFQDTIIIIVETNGKKYGFQIDELIGQQQIVVKSLEANYKNIEGLAGATILGDGRVALILDIEGVVKNAMNYRSRR
ncbi:MAG TPA: chemotaxis protein CheA [Spirochaetia bacterium]|nr:MAG: hypothetical protein A2Y41_08140 [Spirochaetes bacterium GWB1_36_13]HCL56910.1 chemotaxis protein CheA [Spirochaetia bacterium]